MTTAEGRSQGPYRELAPVAPPRRLAARDPRVRRRAAGVAALYLVALGTLYCAGPSIAVSLEIAAIAGALVMVDATLRTQRDASARMRRMHRLRCRVRVQRRALRRRARMRR